MSGMTQADNMTKAEREALREAIIAGRERERQIAADREHRDRRERIATAAMKGLLISGRYFHKPHIAEEAVEAADALIAELDKPKEGGI